MTTTADNRLKAAADTPRTDPQCLAASFEQPGCAAERFKAKVAELERELAAANEKLATLRNLAKAASSAYAEREDMEALRAELEKDND